MKNLLTLAAGMALATTTLAGGPGKNPTHHGDFKVDITKSAITWVGKKVTGEHTGKVTFQNGTILTDGKQLTGGNFTVNMKSITCTDITDAETNGKFIGHISSPDFFDVAAHPAANLVIKSAKKTGPDAYDVTADLTIKGITKPVTFPATVTVGAKQTTAKATVKIDRTEYDIKYGSGKFFEGIGDKAIYDDFNLNLDVVAEAAEPAAMTKQTMKKTTKHKK